MSFDQLNLSSEILRAIADQGYTEPTPALAQLWLFWVAPILGAACAGVVYRTCFEAESTKTEPAPVA